MFLPKNIKRSYKERHDVVFIEEYFKTGSGEILTYGKKARR
jgi:hypothetical protein